MQSIQGINMQRWLDAIKNTRGGETKYKTLVQAIARDIEEGLLTDGTKLPPQRELAQGLGISVQTVSNAYKELERDGAIRCEVGRGSFVAPSMTENVSSYMLDYNEYSIADFSIARIVHSAEHDRIWRQTCADIATEIEQPWMRECRPIAGFEHHRSNGLSWVSKMGVSATMDTLMVTNGASHSVFLALAALAGSDDTVLCGKLTDHSAIGAAHILGFNLKGLDIDEYGIVPDHFEDICASERISALVCIPNIHNPTGAIMPESRRKAIAKIAQRYGVYIIEDDVYGPLMEKKIPAISHYVPELGFYCTSFTKSVMTGLRTGYINVPTRFILRINGILRVNSWMGTPLMAEIASRWIEDGTAEYLIDIQRNILAKRHQMVNDILSEYADQHHPFSPFVWVNVPNRWRADKLAEILRRRGIAITLPEPFAVRQNQINNYNAFRICLGADMEDDEMQRALTEIKNTIEQYPAAHYFI